MSSTLESYLQAYREDWPQDGMEETQFILALCGIITSLFLHTNLQFLQKLKSYYLYDFLENVHIMLYIMLNVVRHFCIMF